MKKIISIILIILFSIGLFYGIKYLFIKSAYEKPRTIITEMIQEARDDRRNSMYIISENMWEEISEDSIYINTRRPLDWNEFKEWIQICKGPLHSLTYDGTAVLDIMRHRYKEPHRSISIICFEYDAINGDHIGYKQRGILLQNIKGSWKVVGQH